MNKYPKISIVIALYVKTDYFVETVERCLNLDYPDFEILIGADKSANLNLKDKRVKIFYTGMSRTGPAEKRDIGILKAKGELIAFIDDDSYPNPDWLKKAVEIMHKQKDTAAVCGPGLTPPADSFSQKLTGSILSSPFGSGPYSYRFKKGSPRFVDDYPAYNLLINRKVLLDLGMFGTKFYGGEDTALCLKLIREGKKILYHPDIVVFHHRRKFPFEYMKQVGNVGLHRGYFVKKYPQTSFRPSYFGPAILTIALPIIAIWSFFDNSVSIFFMSGFLFSYLSVFIYSLFENNFIYSLLLPFALLVNHLTYGSQFLKGLLITKLDR